MIQLPLPAPPQELDPRCPFAPAPGLKELRQEHPICPVTLPTGSVAYFVSSYEMTRKILGDPRFSADVTRSGFPLDGHVGGNIDVFAKSLLRRDEPEHSRLRRLITADFRDTYVDGFADMVREVAHGCLEAVRGVGPPADLVAHYTSEIPSIVVCRFVGIPQALRPQVKSLALSVGNPLAPGERPALERLADLLQTHLGGVRGDPSSRELFARLAALVEQGAMSGDELLSMAVLLALGGHETTANTLALGLARILSDPALHARLIAEPALLDTGVDEIVRMASVNRSGPRRVSTEDVELGGQHYPAGTGFMLSLHGANYDPQFVADAEQMHLGRERPRSHVGFGFGLHQCLGQALARMELKIAIATALAGLPGLKLVGPVEELSFHGASTMYGLRELDVTWDA